MKEDYKIQTDNIKAFIMSSIKWKITRFTKKQENWLIEIDSRMVNNGNSRQGLSCSAINMFRHLERKKINMMRKFLGILHTEMATLKKAVSHMSNWKLKRKEKE